jgi:c-di-GMP-binding flagellar brake protein YcgR
MFEPGKIYKVKVEINPGEIGFGRATIIDKSPAGLVFQLKTSKDQNKVLTKGTRIWFVNDSPDVSFNGLWSSSIVATQVVDRQNVMLSTTPKLEPLVQRRLSQRVNLDVVVYLTSENDEELAKEVRSRDISRSGVALETGQEVAAAVEPGSHVKFVLESHVGPIAAFARIIRVERNWLANKTVLGLEFTDLSEDAVSALDKLLVMLGGKTRADEADVLQAVKESEDKNASRRTYTGLSSWLGTDSGGTKNSPFVGGSAPDTSEPAKPDGSSKNDERKNDESNGEK